MQNLYKKMRLLFDAKMFEYNIGDLGHIVDLAQKANISDYLLNLPDYMSTFYDYFTERFNPNRFDLLYVFNDYVYDDLILYYEDNEGDDEIKPTVKEQELFYKVARYKQKRQQKKPDFAKAKAFTYRYTSDGSLDNYSQSVVLCKAFDPYESWVVESIVILPENSKHRACLTLSINVKAQFDDENPTHKVVWTKYLNDDEYRDFDKAAFRKNCDYELLLSNNEVDEFEILNIKKLKSDLVKKIHVYNVFKNKNLTEVLTQSRQSINTGFHLVCTK